MASFRVRITVLCTAAVVKRWKSYVVGNLISVHFCGSVCMCGIAVAMMPNITMHIISLN